MFKLSGYLNLLFETGSLTERVNWIDKAGLDGIELYGFDKDLASVADATEQHELEWVYLSGERPAFTNPRNKEAAIESIESSLELAEAFGIQYLNVKTGTQQAHLTERDQRAQVIEILEAAGPLAAQTDTTLVLEPLNTTVDHPGHFAATAAKGADIVRAVDHPNVRLLFDCYHEQIMTGDLIRSFRQQQDLIGHVHIADNPGRHQPGTGEINYEGVFKALIDSGYEGYVGCEFMPTPDADPVQILEALSSLRDRL